MKLRCATLLCLFLAAAGCGQKGPLFLPGDPNEGRIVLPDELGGQEQGEQVEEPGDATTDSAAPEDEGGGTAEPDEAAPGGTGDERRRRQDPDQDDEQ